MKLVQDDDIVIPKDGPMDAGSSEATAKVYDLARKTLRAEYNRGFNHALISSAVIYIALHIAIYVLR